MKNQRKTMENKDINRQIAEIMEFEILMTAPNGDLVTKHSNNWSPSTNITQTFEVVEEMFTKEMFFQLENYRGRSKWKAEFLTINDSVLAMKWADTPEIAICLAALEAVKNKEAA